VCPATDPTTNDIVAFSDEICRSAEAEVWERGSEIRHERLDVRMSATGLVQRILQEHVRCGELVNDAEVACGSPEASEPTTYDGFILLFY
jgi:hypothetical protein